LAFFYLLFDIILVVKSPHHFYRNMVKTSYQALHEISTSFTRPISAMNKVSHLVDSLAKKPIGAGDGRGTGAGETRGTDI